MPFERAGCKLGVSVKLGDLAHMLRSSSRVMAVHFQCMHCRQLKIFVSNRIIKQALLEGIPLHPVWLLPSLARRVIHFHLIRVTSVLGLGHLLSPLHLGSIIHLLLLHLLRSLIHLLVIRLLSPLHLRSLIHLLLICLLSPLHIRSLIHLQLIRLLSALPLSSLRRLLLRDVIGLKGYDRAEGI